MERLRCLAREALSWAWLTPQQRLVWAAAIELDAVPLQDHFGTGDTGLALQDQRILEDLKISRDDVIIRIVRVKSETSFYVLPLAVM